MSDLMQHLRQINGDLGQVILINYSNFFWIPGVPEVFIKCHREKKIITKHITWLKLQKYGSFRSHLLMFYYAPFFFSITDLSYFININ